MIVKHLNFERFYRIFKTNDVLDRQKTEHLPTYEDNLF